MLRASDDYGVRSEDWCRAVGVCHFHASHAPSSVVRLPVMAQTRDYGATPADEVSLSFRF